MSFGRHHPRVMAALVGSAIDRGEQQRPGCWAWVGPWRGLLVAAIGGWLIASAGHVAAKDSAQVLVLAPAQVEDANQWSDVVRGLRASGKRVVQVSELGIDPVYAACRAHECAAQLAASTGLTVALFAFLPPHANAEAGLELQLFEPDGQQLTLRTALAARARTDAVAELFDSAKERLSLGDQALLRVTGKPVGGVVWLDGRVAGVTPFEQPTAAGIHRLRVTLSGFRPDERQIELARGEVHALEVRLMRAALPATAARAPRAVSPLNFVLGGALVLIALPALVASINTWVNDGQCLESTSHGCNERARFGTRSALLLVAGGVGFAGGGYLLMARPFELAADVSPQAARLQFRARF
jgi:hypothetical protein